MHHPTVLAIIMYAFLDLMPWRQTFACACGGHSWARLTGPKLNQARAGLKLELEYSPMTAPRAQKEIRLGLAQAMPFAWTSEVNRLA